MVVSDSYFFHPKTPCGLVYRLSLLLFGLRLTLELESHDGWGSDFRNIYKQKGKESFAETA